MMRTIRRVAACLSTSVLAAASMNSMAQNTHTLPLVMPASNGSQTGFVRIVNQSDQNGTVRITAIDDTGEQFGPINLSLDANEAVNFNSRDLESGNARKGLPSGVGDGSGSWRLILETALNITPLAYIRTSDGFVTAMHDIAAATEAGSRRYQILFFNPGSNRNQVSRLRIINTGGMAASVEITALDDPGMSAPGGTISLNVPAGGARTLTAEALETGGSTFSGRLGDGAGKWRLTVSSNVDIQVMNLLATPTGHLANLSTIPLHVGVAPTNPPPPKFCEDGQYLVPGSRVDFVHSGFLVSQSLKQEDFTLRNVGTQDLQGKINWNLHDGNSHTRELVTQEYPRMSPCETIQIQLTLHATNDNFDSLPGVPGTYTTLEVYSYWVHANRPDTLNAVPIHSANTHDQGTINICVLGSHGNPPSSVPYCDRRRR